MIVLVYVDHRRDPPGSHPHNRQSGFPGADGGLALAFKPGIYHHKGPAGGRLGGIYSIITPEEADVLYLIAHIKYAGLAVSNTNVHMGDKAMLGKVGPERHGGRIALVYAEIDIG